ncbi:MAG TPA: VWA domain-containing protein, partial [Bryobacteraceae bacterium]|nr:VWA domain-containing protein [Bryobacteraceae bacterium]
NGGRPAAGLAREDFELLDEGRPQEIRTFLAQAAGITRRASEPLPVNSFSNRLGQQDLPTSVTVILFDQLNTSYADQTRSREHLIRFLEKSDRHRPIAVYALHRNVRVVHDFTSDVEPLLAALQRHRMRLGGELLSAVPAEISTGDKAADALLNEAEERRAHLELHVRVVTTLNALESIAHHLTRLPGRKTLIWLSGSFPFSMTIRELASRAGTTSARPGDYSEELERCARVLNDADIAIYPVHAGGIAADPALSVERQRATLDTEPMDSIHSSHDSMRFLAERTGGRAYYNNNDLAGAMKESFDDGELSYTLGFYPTHGDWNSRFRSLKVRVKRPGLRVRHRTGYFAFADLRETAPERMRALQDAVWSPLDAHGVPLEIRIAVQPDGTWRVTGWLDARSVVLDGSEGDRWTGQVDLLFVQQTRDGQTIAGVTDSVNLSVTSARRLQLIHSGARFGRDLRLLPAAHTFRVVARDARSGAVGSVTIPVSDIVR